MPYRFQFIQRLGEDQLDYIFSDASPEVVVVDQLSKDRLTILKRVSSIKKIIVIGDIEERPGDDSVIGFDDALATVSPSTDFQSSQWKKDRMSDLFTILYTSGTTGVPKAVPLTHENVVSNFLGILDIIPISHTDASLSFLPLSHIFERTVGFVCVMGLGQPFTMPSPSIRLHVTFWSQNQHLLLVCHDYTKRFIRRLWAMRLVQRRLF